MISALWNSSATANCRKILWAKRRESGARGKGRASGWVRRSYDGPHAIVRHPHRRRTPSVVDVARIGGGLPEEDAEEVGGEEEEADPR